eukprot:31395-Pelagococcus_subviridis.AAC.2
MAAPARARSIDPGFASRLAGRGGRSSRSRRGGDRRSDPPRDPRPSAARRSERATRSDDRQKISRRSAGRTERRHRQCGRDDRLEEPRAGAARVERFSRSKRTTTVHVRSATSAATGHRGLGGALDDDDDAPPPPSSSGKETDENDLGTLQTSSRNATPVFSNTAALTFRISASISSAPPPPLPPPRASASTSASTSASASSLYRRKLACASLTTAPPQRVPFNPARSINAPALSPSGFTAVIGGLRNTHPTERSESGCALARRRRNALARSLARGSLRRRNVALATIHPASSDSDSSSSSASASASRSSSLPLFGFPGCARDWNGDVRYPKAPEEAVAARSPPPPPPPPPSSSSNVAILRRPPSGDTHSTSTNAVAVSPPSAPAFMNTAPPTVPGMPTANSRPLQPSFESAAPRWLNA